METKEQMEQRVRALSEAEAREELYILRNSEVSPRECWKIEERELLYQTLNDHIDNLSGRKVR